jgi:hypothetical protein
VLVVLVAVALGAEHLVLTRRRPRRLDLSHTVAERDGG